MMSFKKMSIYFAVIIVATFLTFFLHEFCHWLAYQFLGYDAGFSLNAAGLKDKEISLSKTERIITAAAGPVFTLLQAIVFYFILKKHKNILLYPFLFVPFVMRLGALWANQFKPNDEGRISLDLGLNLYTISTVVVIFLLILLIKISRKNSYSFLFNFITYMLIGIAMFGLVFLDAKYKITFV